MFIKGEEDFDWKDLIEVKITLLIFYSNLSGNS